MTAGADTLDHPGARHPVLGRWVLATAAGTLLGTAACATLFAIGAATVRAVPGPAATVVMFAFTAVAAVAAGSVLGLAQSLILAAHLDLRAGAWVLATAGGALVAVVVTMIVGAKVSAAPLDATSLTVASAAGGALVGAVIGGAQWIVLSRSLARAAGWIAASVVGWGVGVVLATRAVVLLGASTSLPEIVGLVGAGGAALGLTLGAVTGMWLARATTGPGDHA